MDKIFEASFGGCIGNEMYIRVNAENAELNGFKLGIVDNAGIWTALTDNDHFSLSLLEKIKGTSWEICLGKKDGKKTSIYRLKNNGIRASRKYTEEIYDRRELFGKLTEYGFKGKRFLPYYKVDGTLMLDLVKKKIYFQSS